MPNSKEWAYMAGLFDGEGCIHINKWSCSLKNGHAYGLLAQIKMCDGRLLPELHKKFGGNLNLIKRSLKNPKHSDILIWRIQCRKAQAFLETLLPYLKLKKRQAEVAISFQDHMPLRGRGRTPVSKEEIAHREQCYLKLRELKVAERTYRLL